MRAVMYSCDLCKRAWPEESIYGINIRVYSVKEESFIRHEVNSRLDAHHICKECLEQKFPEIAQKIEEACIGRVLPGDMLMELIRQIVAEEIEQ